MASAPPTFAVVFGEFLRRLRTGHGQHWLAEKTGISQSVISDIETGARTVRGEHVEMVLSAFDMNVATMCVVLQVIAENPDSIGKDKGKAFVEILPGKDPSFVRRDAVEDVLREVRSAEQAPAPGRPVATRKRAARKGP